MDSVIKKQNHTTIIAIIIIVSLTFYLSTMLQVFPSGIPVTSGDAAIYAKSIEKGDMNLNHLGYLLLGRALYLYLNNTYSLVEIVNLISVIFGALSLTFCYLISKKILNSSKDALMSTFIVMISGTYWLYSIAIEIYVLQLFFIWGALYFMLERKLVASTLFFFISLFASLTSIFFLPVLVYTSYINRYLKKFTLMLSASTTLYLIVSYKQISYVLNGASTGMHLVAPLANLYYLTQSFIYFLPLALIGFCDIHRNDKEINRIMLFAALPYTYFLFFNWDHGVFMLPIYVFIAICAVQATRKGILIKTPLILTALTAFFLFELLFVVSPVIQESLIFDDFIKSHQNLTTNSRLYTRYDYGEIYNIVLKSEYISYMKPYQELKKEINTEIKNNKILVLDLERSRIDSKNIRDYHSEIHTDYRMEEIACSTEFNIYTIWMTLRENRYCIYEIKLPETAISK